MLLSCQADAYGALLWAGSGDTPIAVRSIRSTTGNWTITGLAPLKPAYIQLHSPTTAASEDRAAHISPLNGLTVTGDSGNLSASGRYFRLGRLDQMSGTSPLTETVIPTSTTVTFGVLVLTPGCSLQLLQ